MYSTTKSACETWPYLQAGNPATPPLIFLHGFLGSGEDWLLCAEQLRDSYYCIMPDLPGCGRNVQRRFNEPLQLEQISKELVQFIQRQNINDFVLVGYSMGARVALHATTQNYVTPRALVLESGNPGIEDKSERQKRAELDQQRSERIRDEGLENFLRDWYSTELFGNIAARPAEFKPLLAQRLKTNSAQWAAKVIEDLSPGRIPSLWGLLAENKYSDFSDSRRA